MNDKAVWSQSASYACMWYSNPPSLLPQREVSKLQKKRGGRKKKKGYVCVQIFKTKPSNLLQSSHKVFLPGFVEVKKKAHVNPKGRKKVGAAKKKHPLVVSKGVYQCVLWMQQPWGRRDRVHFGQISPCVRKWGGQKGNGNHSGSKNGQARLLEEISPRSPRAKEDPFG